MALETATYIDGLNASNPLGTDPKSQGDDHIRLLKSTIKATLPNITGAVTATQAELNILDGATLSTVELNVLDGITASTAELNFVDGVTSAIQPQLDAKAPLISPALTGTPTAPTAAPGTNTTQIATTAHVFTERSNTATLTNKTLTAPVINSPTGLVKGDVGLGNVDNTSDANKPVSTATQTALNGKQDLDADLTAIAGLASNGLIARTGAGTAAVRTLTAGAGVTITNGDGVSGNPTIGITPGVGTGDVIGPAGATDGHAAVFDGATGKIIKSLGGAPVSKAGDTMTGNLTAPSLNTGQLAGLRNKIINGKMEIAQRGTSFPAASSFVVDRWSPTFAGSTGVVDITQSSDVPSGNEFQSSLRLTVSTADASIASTDRYQIRQIIEGYNARDLIGRAFTLSFWVRSSKTGVHCISLANAGDDRSYVVEYTINVANTWEKKSVTVGGGLITAGTWDWTNGRGLWIFWTLAAGSSFHATPNVWNDSVFRATANQVNCLDTIGNVFAITGVQLEVGSVATPFEHRPYGMELALCQRYYYRIDGSTPGSRCGPGLSATSTIANVIVNFPVTMRVRPTALEQSGTATDYRILDAATGISCNIAPSYATANTSNADVNFVVASGLTIGRSVFGVFANANSYLGFSAEL